MSPNKELHMVKFASRGILAIAIGLTMANASAEVDPETCMARCKEHKVAEDKCQRICKPKQGEGNNTSAFDALKS